MISKKLAIAAAIALLTGLGAGQAFAQTNDAPPAPAMASPSGRVIRARCALCSDLIGTGA